MAVHRMPTTVLATGVRAVRTRGGRRATTAPAPPGGTPPRWPRRVGIVVGGMMLGGAALNTVLVTTRPEVYAELGTWFVDLSPWSLGPLEELWRLTFAEHPRVWGTVVGVGYEATVGVLALSHDPHRRLVGLGGVALFKVGLLAMGLWGWALPWLVVLVPTIVVTARAAHADRAPVGGTVGA
ncbi:hypothetical protein [Georgenia sp. H159]|uniref:hypothetical protein n=1 Tax=Georgenia sp. H159 TaxID=3076115 RepID=UPI002D779323|nr:hypothetical protein [Georgenia sp. H159]